MTISTKAAPILRNSQKPRVAVLLAAYNGSKWIDEQIVSILNQMLVDVSIIISVDLSTDDTFDKCMEWSKKDSRVSVLDYGQRFGDAAQNFFHLCAETNVSSFDAVAFADQDDIWFGDKLVTALYEMSESNCVGYSSDVLAYWRATGKKKLVKKSWRQTDIDHWFESPGPGCSQVFTASSFQNFQNFVLANTLNLRLVSYHDWLIYAFYRFNNLPWKISGNPKMLYMQHDQNQIGANKGLQAIYKRISMVNDGWYQNQIELIYRLVSGSSRGILSRRFLFFGLFKIRRNKISSIFIGIFLLARFQD